MMSRGRLASLSVLLGLLGRATSAIAEADAPPSVSDALANDGVKVQTVCTNCNNADLSLGGLGNDFVPITCDELPVTTGLAQIYLLSVMPATMIDKVAVERGACDAAREAAAIGGGITIERSTPEPGIQVNASADAGAFGWVGARADVAGRREWFAGTFAATYATSDAIDSNSDTNPDLPSFDRRTIEGHVEFTPSDRHALRVGAADYVEHQKDGPSGFDFLSYPRFTGGEIKFNRENVDLARRQYDLVYEGVLADASKLTIGGLYADRSEDIVESLRWNQPVVFPTYQIDEENTAGSLAWSRPVGTAWQLQAGASWLSRDYAVVDVFFNSFHQRPPDFALTEKKSEAGAWSSFEYAPSSSIDLTVGLRYASFDYTDNETRPYMLAHELPHGSKVLPRLALKWKPADAWMVRITAGAGYRQAQPTYDEVCCGRQYRNNRGIDMEESRSVGIEGIYQPGPKLKLGAAAYVTSFDNYVLKMISSSFYYRPTYQNANVPHARFATLELDAAWTIAPWIEIKGSIAWLDASNSTDGDAIPVLIDTGSTLLPYTFHSKTIPYVAECHAALGVTLRPIRTGRVSVVGAYTGPMLIQQMQASGATAIGGTLTELYETPSFATLGVRYDQTLPKGITLYAGVDNATDFIQTTMGKPRYNYNWGPLRGRYVYGGLSYNY